MMATSYILKPEQQQALAAAQQDTRRQTDGMAKWEIHFTDGNTCTMLSDQCRNTQEAMQAAIERFGHRVKDVL